MKPEKLYSEIALALKQLKIDAPVDIEKVVRYLQLLQQWNKAYNLTAITEPSEMIQKHLADSWATHSFIYGPRIIDVGSGAGLPGIPLALLFPLYQFTLLDSNGKKTAFLQHVVQQLELTNVTVVNSRVENYQPPHLSNTVLTRAFSSLQDMLLLTRHLCSPQGYFVAMKGQVPHEELRAIVDNYPNYRIEAINVPGLNAERHCIIIAAHQKENS